jgi:hypothetical protein
MTVESDLTGQMRGGPGTGGPGALGHRRVHHLAISGQIRPHGHPAHNSSATTVSLGARWTPPPPELPQ